MSDDTIYPPSASKRGDNAYYIGRCGFVGHSPAYAACLSRLDNKDEVCCAAARAGGCQAKTMRETEELQGKAVYYIPRQKLKDGLVKAPPWVMPSTTTAAPTPIAPAPAVAKARKSPVSDEGSYADAINAALSQPAPAKPVAPRPALQPGETPIQYARRCAAARETTKEQATS